MWLIIISFRAIRLQRLDQMVDSKALKPMKKIIFSADDYLLPNKSKTG